MIGAFKKPLSKPARWTNRVEVSDELLRSLGTLLKVTARS